MPDLTIEKLHLFLLVVLPGVIALKVYDLFHPPDKRDFGSSLIEAVAYGVINFGLWVWPLVKLNTEDFPKNHPVWYAVGSFGMLVVSPALLAGLAYFVRTRKCVARWIGYPARTAWDDFFKRKKECWVLFHLKDKKMLGGFFGVDSYATAFPHPQELYVQEVWRVDDEGRFVEIVPGTFGMIIRSSECERIELLRVEEEK